MNISFRSTDKTEPSKPPPTSYGDGSNKIFGMENFGNTCYCNSILQCLYYSEPFRTALLTHNPTPHERRLVQAGTKIHGFTSKYESLLNKKIKEIGLRPPPNVPSNFNNAHGNNNNVIYAPDQENDGDKPKISRKSSIFGLKFNPTASSSASATTSETHDKYAGYVCLAKDVEALPHEQRLRISKSSDFQRLKVLVTRPTSTTNTNQTTQSNSQSSSQLLGDTQKEATEEGSIGPTSSTIIIGIPQPEMFLPAPINPFSANPTVDHRKRSALINGPIVNIDSALRDTDDNAVLLNALKDVFECMVENKSTTGVVSPTHFITKLKERNYLFRQNNMHHDAHEFFNYLVNEIIESLGKEHNWCNNLFQGVITNETKCLMCETVTSKNEFFLDLSVDIPPGQSAYSLSSSLNNFSRSEILTNRNKFYCNTCSSLQEATKTIKLAKLPEILVVNLKRFKYDEKVDKMVKLFDSISYPFKLRLFNTTDKCDKEPDGGSFSLYGLYALVIHIGGGPMHGHYVALCKVKAGLWLLFDDETVEMVADSYVMRFFGDGPGLASAYILFYQKVHYPNEDEATFGYSLDEVTRMHEFELAPPASSGSSFKKEEESDQASTVPSSHSNETPPAPFVPEAQPAITRKGSVFKKGFTSDKKIWSLRKDDEKPRSPDKPEERKKSWFGFKKK